jgi:CO/xanthine dehydrogenase FAD-binding subunit
MATKVRLRDGLVTEARLAIGWAGSAPMLATKAAGLIGRTARGLDEAALDAVADDLDVSLHLKADDNGSYQYKRQLTRVLSRQCLRQALDEAAA